MRKDSKKHRNDCKGCHNKHSAQYYKKNRKKVIKGVMEYERKRKKRDKKYKVMKLVRRRLQQHIQKLKCNKCTSTQKLTGCTWEYLKQWIESQMTDTMTFDTIHIDHIMPLSSFDLTKPEEQYKSCHYTNLQPMLPSENIAKGSKIVYDMRWNGTQWEIQTNGVYQPRDKNKIQ